MSYGEYRPPSGAPVVQLQVADRRPYQYNVNSSTTSTTSADTHGPARLHTDSLFDVGIFKDTLAPSLALHSGMAVVAWAAGRSMDRVDAKDWLWPSGQVVNAWWSSIGRRVFVDGVPFARALAILSRPERLLLTGVTLWGGRLFYRIASRSVARGRDDPRYEAEKKQEGFWAKALVGKFLPEALFQTVVSLPFVAPFRHQGAVMSGYHPYVQAFAVGLFSAGFGLGVLADYQLEQHEQKGSAAGVLREGVWSIVRNPSHLGDALMHASFPLMLYGSDMLAPLELLGPVANYVYLRYFGVDSEKEESQSKLYGVEEAMANAQSESYRRDKNFFWPNLAEVQNPWVWVVLGCGLAGVGIEQAFRMLH